MGLAIVSILNIDRLRTSTQRMASAAAQLSNTPERSRRLEHDEQVIISMINEHTLIKDLCLSMKTLSNIQGSLTAPIILFHSINVLTEHKDYLHSCTERSVSFVYVDLNVFPEGFVPMDGRDYTLGQINRFWTTTVWTQPEIASYSVIMRFDHDTCFSIPDTVLPNFVSSHQNYHSHYFPGTVELNVQRLQGMYEFSHNYMDEHELVPGHNPLWQRVHFTNHAIQSLPNFQDSFEVVRKSFMLREDVKAWHLALTDSAPYGYFTQGWNVDAERFLTMALFGSKTSVDTHLVPGFMQKNLLSGRRHPRMCS